MRLWGYYAWHTFINTIKKLFTSTALIIILAIFGFGVIGGLTAVVVEHAVDTKNATEIETQTQEAAEDEEEDEKEEKMSPEEVKQVKVLVEAALGLGFLVILLWGLYSGTKKGTEIFSMADVNFLFTAPYKPQSVLMFRLSFQLAATVFGSIYLVFQIPNLMINMGLGIGAVIAIFVGWIMLFVFQRLMMVLSYTVFTTHENLKKYVVPGILAVSIVILAALAGVYLSGGRDWFGTVQTTFGSEWMRYVPIVGWFKGMIMSAVNAQLLPFLIYLGLLIVSIGIIVFIIWHVKADFYEDALSAAGQMQAVQTAAQEGRSVRVKERSKKISRSGSFGGSGASAFFTKEVYCRRRMAKLGFLTNTMLFYLAVAVLCSLFMIKVMNTQNFVILGIILLAIMFFRNFGNPIAQETAMNWLFLVPDDPYKKVFYAMMAGSYSCLIDLIPGLFAGMIILEEKPWIVLLWLLTLVVTDFMLAAVGVFLDALFSSGVTDVVKAMLQMLLRFLVLPVLAIVMAVGYMFGGQVLALVLTMACSILIGGLIFLVYPSMLHSGRK